MMTRNDTPNNYVGILNSPKYIPLNPSSPNHDNSKTQGTVCLGILSNHQCPLTQSMLSKSNAFMFCCFGVFVSLLTLARTVKPASVTCEQRAASRILRKTHAMWMNDSVWVCVLCLSAYRWRKLYLSHWQLRPRAVREASVMLLHPDTQTICSLWQPRHKLTKPSSVICCKMDKTS